ncbi:hypothetical protein [Streptomyces fradiae]|uniref:hypothetical protein n=1 Tax=Streptomyces fradiae TaxID=1906 RepID=UPI0036F4CF65
MSAAEPVRPPGRHIIRLVPRRADRPADTGTPPPPAASPVPALAETVEAMFLEEGLTLTDPATARAFDVTMSAVVLLVQGAQEEGVLAGDAYTILRRILDDIRATPTHL